MAFGKQTYSNTTEMRESLLDIIRDVSPNEDTYFISNLAKGTPALQSLHEWNIYHEDRATSVDAEIEANAAAEFSVTATSSPTVTLAYQWEESADGSTWADVADGGVYSGNTTATLEITDSTDLEGYYYRVEVSNSAAGVSVTSNEAQIIFTE